MNTKKILGVVAVLMLVAFAFAGVAAAEDTKTYYAYKATGVSEWTYEEVANADIAWDHLKSGILSGWSGDIEVLLTIDPTTSTGVYIPTGTYFTTLNSETTITVPAGATLKLVDSEINVVAGKTITVTGDGNAVYAGNVAGVLNLNVPTTVPTGETLTVAAGGALYYNAETNAVNGTLTVAAATSEVSTGGNLYNKGVLTVNGTLTVADGIPATQSTEAIPCGNLYNNGKIINNGKIYGGYYYESPVSQSESLDEVANYSSNIGIQNDTVIENYCTITGYILNSNPKGSKIVWDTSAHVAADVEDWVAVIDGSIVVNGDLTIDKDAELWLKDVDITVNDGEGSIIGEGKLYIDSDVIIKAASVDVEVGTYSDNEVLLNFNLAAGGLKSTDAHVVIYPITNGKILEDGGKLVGKDGYVAIEAREITSVTPVYTGAICNLLNVNGLLIYVDGSGSSSDDNMYAAVVFDDAGKFVTFSDDENGVLLNGAFYDVKGNNYNVTVNGVTAGKDVSTIVNAYYYVMGYNDAETGILTQGNVYIDNNGNSFTVPSASGWYLKPEDAPAGTYYHKTGDGANDYDQMVYVGPAKLSYSNISNSTIYTEAGQTPTDTTITLEDANDMHPYIIFEKADVEGVFATMGMNVEKEGYGTFTVNADSDYKGTWNVYADFSQTVVYNAETDKYEVVSQDNLYEKTPVEYKYVKIGSFKIASDKADTDSSLTVSTEELTDGNVFSITVESDYDKNSVNYVTVEYYEDGDKSDDAVKIYEKGVKSDAKFFYVVGQAAYNDEDVYDEETGKVIIPEGTFVIPSTKAVTIGIQADVKALTDKTYHFEVYTSATADEKKGGSDNPMTFDIKVKGNTFTANLAKTSYVKGENVTVEGSYSNTDENFKPYVYVEGTNTAFFAPSYAIKYTSANPDGTAAKTVKDGEYELIFAGSNFSDLNAGTYTVYVSKELCYEVANIDTMSTAQYDQYNAADATASKLETIENAKVLTLVLKESMIEITAVTKEVQAGFNSNNDKGYYLTAQIEAEGTEKISLYIVGQNKLFYIDGDYAKQQGYVKTLSKNNPNYLYSATDSSTGTTVDNNYYYDGIETDKSVSKVTQKLGTADEDGSKEYVEENYPLYLIIDNENGTFTVYIHIQASGENTDENGNVRYNFDTELGLGQYYLVAQHPMADGVFNTFAGWFENGTAFYYDEEDREAEEIISGGYTSGNNVYTNAALKFNVPSVQNLAAAQALVEAIEAGNDSQHGKDFYVVAQATDAEFITAPSASYKQGETITIVVGNVNGSEYASGTLEANTFDFTAENLNYIQTFAVTSKTNEDTGLETVTFTLDTSQVPGGDYNIILRDDDNKVLKVYETKIVATTTPVVEVTVSIAGASSLTVGDTTVLTAKNSDGSTATFAWKSSDASVASVDENGNVVAKKAGTVTITVENTVTGKTATKTIVVADQSTPVTPTPTTTPGFGILAALAGLGAVAALVLRRK